ncbi:hypothetical protein KUW09_15520 [Mameliella alba]|nr:hypothetical protein [Antarctobacter heliothermus]MBY6145463.1 hypothetical protein [Mameliella alba]MBY6160787.1 hypothetical protein [Mameliella alba]MBY6169257.1 hypothetical protein [Mameliella alba]MBY6174276.1 hypothetical protein [Mameliella alba]
MKTILAAALLAATSGAALADDVVLTKTLSGAALHEGPVNMNLFLVEDADDVQLVASYVTGKPKEGPARLVMRLADGEKVVLGLPGAPGYHFSFARAGDAVSVSSYRYNEAVTH